MLESTFIFLKGIGEATEQRLWEQGIDTWSAFLAHPSIPSISPARKNLYDHDLEQAVQNLSARNSKFFARLLKARDHWRLFQTFRSKIAFLDIETNGDPPETGEITLVGIYGNGTMTTLIQGESLNENRLNHELSKYDLLVTFFGSGFDLPYIRYKFPRVLLDHAHFDLCFAARRLGYKGGLKHIELECGLSRSRHVAGLTGWDAVNLWHAWQGGDSQAGTQLLQYNEADVKNLEPLAELLYDKLVRHYGLERKL
ncbi:MAG: ribonuclease H-like domain-containing protein [Nitrospirales bacterium]|nr:ribonuclease H-like domain-containing protein [Nitrospirales bacterium]